MTNASVTRVYPAPMVSASLNTLYLREDIRHHAVGDKPFVYTNFITSMDGRVAVRGLGERSTKIPPTIANKRDWRLYQELAAQADAIIVSAGHARAMPHDTDILPFPYLEPVDTCDLKRWRVDQGLSPAPALAVVSASMDVPFAGLVDLVDGPEGGGLICVTTDGANPDAMDRAKRAGAVVLRAGNENKVTGSGLARALMDQGYGYLYSVAGAGVMKTLLKDRVLDRLYLTQVHRLIGGSSFDTLVEASTLKPPVDLSLVSMFEDGADDLAFSQTYAAYDVV